MPIVGSTYSKTVHRSSPRWTAHDRRQATPFANNCKSSISTVLRLGFLLSGGGIAAEAQSQHDRCRVSIDYRRGRGIIFYVPMLVLKHTSSSPLTWCGGGLVVDHNNNTNRTLSWGATENPTNRSYFDVATSTTNAQAVTAVLQRWIVRHVRRYDSSRNGCRNRTRTHFTNRYEQHSSGDAS